MRKKIRTSTNLKGKKQSLKEKNRGLLISIFTECMIYRYILPKYWNITKYWKKKCVVKVDSKYWKFHEIWKKKKVVDNPFPFPTASTIRDKPLGTTRSGTIFFKQENTRKAPYGGLIAANHARYGYTWGGKKSKGNFCHAQQEYGIVLRARHFVFGDPCYFPVQLVVWYRVRFLRFFPSAQRLSGHKKKRKKENPCAHQRCLPFPPLLRALLAFIVVAQREFNHSALLPILLDDFHRFFPTLAFALSATEENAQKKVPCVRKYTIPRNGWMRVLFRRGKKTTI